MGYTVYGYVLMDNHYHLVIQTFDKKLQEIMHQINNKIKELDMFFKEGISPYWYKTRDIY